MHCIPQLCPYISTIAYKQLCWFKLRLSYVFVCVIFLNELVCMLFACLMVSFMPVYLRCRSVITYQYYQYYIVQ